MTRRRPRAPPRRRRVRPILAIAAVVVVSAGAGLALALRKSPTRPAPASSTDVTLSVAATPARAVTITWADVTNRAGFITYVLYDGNRIEVAPTRRPARLRRPSMRSAPARIATVPWRCSGGRCHWGFHPPRPGRNASPFHDHRTARA